MEVGSVRGPPMGNMSNLAPEVSELARNVPSAERAPPKCFKTQSLHRCDRQGFSERTRRPSHSPARKRGSCHASYRAGH
eukprot:8583979-Pyramimonas_sp.AAC.2